ncbi:MAG: hypothetical protein ACRD0W_19425 [Acidimicrobiales bacterium]
MASTATLAFTAAAASAAVAFALVNIIGSAASPADLGDPVVVEPSDATTSVQAPQTTPGTTVQPLDPESPEARDDGDDDDDDDGGDD